jgi:hypothetical protein
VDLFTMAYHLIKTNELPIRSGALLFTVPNVPNSILMVITFSPLQLFQVPVTLPSRYHSVASGLAILHTFVRRLHSLSSHPASSTSASRLSSITLILSRKSNIQAPAISGGTWSSPSLSYLDNCNWRSA